MSAESEHVHYFVIGVPSFGRPEQTLADVELRLARSLHHHVTPGCSIRRASFDHGGNYISAPLALQAVTLDPKGDDMGHHEGHDVPLVPTDG